jgi:exosortase family protein XrtM
VEKKKDRWRDVRGARLRFAVVFALSAGVLLTVYSFPYAEHGMREDLFTWYLGAYARLSGWVIRLFDPSAHVAGTDVIGRTSLTIAKYCDAMDVNLLLIAAMLACPSSWKRRLVGIVAGVLLLSVVNIGRIVALYQIGVHAPGAFEFVHAELFPLLMVVLAVGVFVVWARWSRQLEPARIGAARADA